MARGDMRYASIYIKPAGVEILNREPKECIPMTLDFSNVETKENDTGEKVVRAGSVINANGAVVASTPWTGGIGLLLEDVYEHSPQGTILKKGYVNKARAEANANITYDEALITALTAASAIIVIE